MRHAIWFLLVPLALGSVQACSCENPGVGMNQDLAGVDPFDTDMYIGVPSGDGGIVIQTDAGTILCFITPCQGKVYQCGNCRDDDGDGLYDSQDPNCLGACQNNEQGFFGNIPGQNNAPCKMDCYWDQDTGSGNDTCEWNHQCDPFEQGPPPATNPEIGCTYNANERFPGGESCMDKLMSQPQTCTDFCKPLTPNGCDCFGCCENPNSPGNYVWAGSANAAKMGTCNADPATLADSTKCKPCTPVPGCQNGCGRCELCFGKTTLPADCYPDMGGQPPYDGGPIVAGQCDPGVQACGLPGQPPCAPGTYCVTGCCQNIIF
jgi:hypothetical protein